MAEATEYRASMDEAASYRAVLENIAANSTDPESRLLASAVLNEAEDRYKEQNEALAKLHKPVIEDFFGGVKLEMAHQVERWGTTHDRNKSPPDWFWLLGYLSGKALAAAVLGDRDKALHHCISSAAVLGHWHAAIKSGMKSLKVEHTPSQEAGVLLGHDNTKSSDLERHLDVEPETSGSTKG